MNRLIKNSGIALAMVLVFSCTSDDKVASCELEPDPGPCEAYMIRYYFDKEEQKCKEFVYGGCQGTVPFQTMEECRECEKS
ncbi:BPTI/Kunitz domain-containing protein [Flagellimonas sp.]|uniref:BPTI/Kunitz domain-containing protein n=1 Tax=Flagellimonas sp. TaxID=2058762 RepID=UPI003B50C400